MTKILFKKRNTGQKVTDLPKLSIAFMVCLYINAFSYMFI